MSQLIICLPLTAHTGSSSYDYALTTDGRTLTDHASVPLALLPAATERSDVVAVVPASALSWHAAALPKGVGSGSPRLRAVLDNLLEDQLLDEPTQLHLALAPDTAAGEPVWVAACDKAWLRSHLQALESAGRPVTRIVPEFAPESGPLQLNIVGEPDAPQLIVTGKLVGSVMQLRFNAAALALIPAPNQNLDDTPAEVLVFAEPSVAGLAEQLLQFKVNLLTRQQRWLEASRSPWDLAQFDLANSSRTRTLKRLSGFGQDLLQAPGWKPMRWGAVFLLAVNLIGLNAWSWREQSALQAQSAQTRSILIQNFPQVKVVVDAPLQMEREVAALRQATGAASGYGLEAMLAALGTSTPKDRTASAVEWSNSEVKVKGLQLTALEATTLSVQLRGQGYAATSEGDTLTVKPGNQEGASP